MVKKQIKSNSSIARTFDYNQNGVRLNFTLRIDVKQELKDFLELLKLAEKEVEEEINKTN